MCLMAIVTTTPEGRTTLMENVTQLRVSQNGSSLFGVDLFGSQLELPDHRLVEIDFEHGVALVAPTLEVSDGRLDYPRP